MHRTSERGGQQREMLITKDSLRPPCKRTRSRSRCETPQQKEEPKEQERINVIPEVKPKCRRQWEQWGEDDQEIFFQGLAEYGKDYGKIKLLMTKKLKSKSADEMKTKEQIRHFYHRTWTKISKTLMLQHEPDSKKAYRREIHYMLCLGEIRRKGIQGLGQKVLQQLDELVTKGSTYIRYRGRNVRLRPPNRFLKKLYRDVNSNPELNLPKHVQIEFLPNTNTAFNFVQKHAFNPRLRFTSVNINAKLSQVFDMIDKRFTDLYTNETLTLLIYPLHRHVTSPEQFAEKIADADELLESCFQKQETPIVLENLTKSTPEKSIDDKAESSDDGSEFPRIFGKNNDQANLRKIKPFAGHWTRETAADITVRTLYVALGQIDFLKFKYEWKRIEENKTNFISNALEYLHHLCKEEIKPKEILQPPKAIAPKLHNHAIKSFQNVVTTVLPVQSGTRLKSKNQLGIPHPPRPGRARRTNLSSQQSVLRNRIIAPRLTPSNGTLLSNAVAVSLIPQPQEYLQFSSLPPDSMKIINNMAACANGTSPLPNTFTYINSPSNMSTESTVSYEEEVVDEGFRKDFQALNNILTSALISQDQLQTVTPKKEHMNVPMEISPMKLAWLDETQELTLNTFLDVCQMQEIQQKQQELGHELRQQGIVLNESIEESLVTKDPSLPIYHSGDTSHGAFDMKFEGSNPEKSKDGFAY